MSNLTPYNRKNDPDKKQKDILNFDKVFEMLLSDTFFSNFTVNSIKADIRETEKEYVLEAELPGVTKEEIDIDFRDDKLTIYVERNSTVNEEREGYIKRERRYGAMSRVFHLPYVNKDEIKAKYENGILVLRLPKYENVVLKSSRINIE